MVAISVNQVTKTFKRYEKQERILDNFFHRKYLEKVAVDHVSFQIHKGECVAVIGQNGAGKTTMMKLMSGLLLPTTGKIEVLRGDFDYILLKPCSSQFYVSLRYFYFGAVPSVIFSFALLLYALVNVGAKITVAKVIIFFVDIVAAIVICYSIWFLIMILSILFIKIGAMHELFLSALKFLEYPQNIYKGMIRILMIYIIPLATVSNVPAEKLLGKVGMIDTIEIVLLAIVFFILTRICYRLALKRYSSASS